MMNKFNPRTFLDEIAKSGDPVIQMEAISGIVDGWTKPQSQSVSDDDPRRVAAAKLAIDHIDTVLGRPEVKA